MKAKKILFLLLMMVGFAGFFGAGFYVGKVQVVCPVCQPSAIDFSLFWEAYNKLSSNFVNPEKIDNQKIIYGAIKGMSEGLGDSYTSFFNPEQSKKFNDDLSGYFSGIGAEVGIKKDQLIIIAPLEGTPAQKAGLQAGDAILKINGASAQNISVEEAVNLIRGPKGTAVVLNMYREGWNFPKDIEIIRDTIKVPSMKWELKDGNVAYVRIYQFDQSLSADFRKAAFEIMASQAQKIVLDLRGNPGGYLELSQEIAGWFLNNGQIVTIEDFGNNKDQNIYKAEGRGELAKYPMVALIDEGTASASEILAGALRDNKNVMLVGQKSFGKGSVQQIFELRDGSSLKITIAKWLTPKGVSISEVGLTPDTVVQITDKDVEAKKDPQLQKALEIIKNLK